MSLNSAIPIASHSISAGREREAPLRQRRSRGVRPAAITRMPRRAGAIAQQRAQQRPAEQQPREHLEAEALARERADAGEQARRGGRDDRDRVALGLRALGVAVARDEALLRAFQGLCLRGGPAPLKTNAAFHALPLVEPYA